MISRATTWTDERISTCRRRRMAFMLIELVVVLVIISIVAGATVMSLRQPLQTARLKRAVASFEDADRRARMEARRSGKFVKLTIDGRGGQVMQSIVGGQRSDENRLLALSGGLMIDRILGASNSSNNNRFTVTYMPNGRSPTYAVRIKADSDNPQSKQIWLVVVGASSQYIKTDEDSVVEQIVQR